MEKKSKENLVEFEEAIRRCGFGKFNYILFALSGGLLNCAFIELTSVNFIMPVAACDLNLTTRDKGILSAIGYVGLITSSHFWGFLSDTRGRRKILIGSTLMAFAATFVSTFVNDFWLLLAFRFINGFL